MLIIVSDNKNMIEKDTQIFIIILSLTFNILYKLHLFYLDTYNFAQILFLFRN